MWMAITSTAALLVGLTMVVAAEPGRRDLGKEIAERGSSGGAASCTTCHGPQLRGGSVVGAPAIAGRPTSYVMTRLEHYAGPDGRNPMMRQVARLLSVHERSEIARYVASLPSQGMTQR
jgi:cytochrome c553